MRDSGPERRGQTAVSAADRRRLVVIFQLFMVFLIFVAWLLAGGAAPQPASGA